MAETRDDLIADAAANLAGWHDSSLRALGLECERDAALWRASMPGPSVYFCAVTLGSGERTDDHLEGIEELAGTHPSVPLTVCDSFNALDLAPLGFERLRTGTWMVRKPADPQRRPFPADLVIERVITPGQLAEWEAASAMGFGSPAPTPGSLHGAGILSDARMQVFAGKVDGKVVAGSMGYLTERVNGVYGVSTIPGHRRRGYAEWLTWRAILGRPHQPTILQPGEESEPLYHRMGFEPMGQYTAWHRGPAEG